MPNPKPKQRPKFRAIGMLKGRLIFEGRRKFALQISETETVEIVSVKPQLLRWIQTGNNIDLVATERYWAVYPKMVRKGLRVDLAFILVASLEKPWEGFNDGEFFLDGVINKSRQGKVQLSIRQNRSDRERLGLPLMSWKSFYVDVVTPADVVTRKGEFWSIKATLGNRKLLSRQCIKR